MMCEMQEDHHDGRAIVMQVLFVLQNAWRKSAKTGEIDLARKNVWNRLLWRSQTGRRLKEMIPKDITFEVVNASAMVGNYSASVYPADQELMAMRLGRIMPTVVALCGKVAAGLAPLVEATLTTLVIAPHPAWRALSKEHTARIKEEIELALRDRFPVTDDLMDAPEGAVVNGYARIGNYWERLYHNTPRHNQLCPCNSHQTVGGIPEQCTCGLNRRPNE